jgi:hypothetical protein
MRGAVLTLRGRRTNTAHESAATPQDVRGAGTSPKASASNIVVTSSACAARTISLVGREDAQTAAIFFRIGSTELRHCERMVVDFGSSENLSADVINALVALVLEAKKRGVAFEITLRKGTYAHDVLELFGLLDKVNWTEGNSQRGT